MAILGTLQIRALLDTANFGTKFNAWQKDIQKRATAFQKSLSGLTGLGNLGMSVGATTGLQQMISTAGEFELTMNKIKGASGATAAELASLSKSALDMGRTTTFSANQAASGMLELVKAGLTPAQISSGALASTIQLAATENMELATASTVVAEAMGAFKLNAEQSGVIVNALAGASIASTAGVADMAQALSQSSAVAHIAGQNINTMTGALALMAQNGIKGSDAGTSLKTMLLRLEPQTDNAAEAMKFLGLNFKDSKGNFLDLAQVAEQLHNKLGKMSESQKVSALQAVFGTDAMRAAAIMTEAGAAGLNTYIDATKDQTAASKLAEAQQKGWLAAIARLKNAFSNLSITLASGGLLDSLTALVMKGVDLVNRLGTLPEWAKQLAVGFAAALAVLPPLALAISSLVTAGPALVAAFGSIMGLLTGPWGLALGAFLLFKDEILMGVQTIRQWFGQWVASNQGALSQLSAAWQQLKAAFGPLVDALKVTLGNFATALMQALGVNSSQAMTSFSQVASAALTGLVNGLTTAINWVTKIVQWLTVNLPAAGTAAGDAVGKLTAWVAEKFAEWGPIFDKGKVAMQALWDFLKSTGEAIKALFELIGTAVAALWHQFEKSETGKAAIEGVKNALQYLWDKAKEVSSALADIFKGMWEKGKEYMDKLSGSIKNVTQWLDRFTNKGYETKKEANDQCWLKDMCLDGANFFQHLIGSGIQPTIKELGNLTKAGEAVKISPAAMQAAQGMKVDDWGQGWVKYGKQWEKVKRAKVVDENKLGAELEPPKGLVERYRAVFDSIGSAIDELVETGKVNFKGLWQSFAMEMTKNLLKNGAMSLINGIGGLFGGMGGGGGGFWGGLASAIGGAFSGASFAGGGYTGSGSRTGGMDGKGGFLAMMHPQESVIDHTQVRGARPKRQGGGVNLTVPISLAPGVSHEELSRVLPQVQEKIIRLIPDLIQRGGSYSAAFGM